MVKIENEEFITSSLDESPNPCQYVTFRTPQFFQSTHNFSWLK